MWVKTQDGEYLNLARARAIYVQESGGRQELIVRFLAADADVNASGNTEPEQVLASFEERHATIYEVVLEELLRGTAYFIDLTGAPHMIEQRFWHSTRNGGDEKGHELH